MEKLSDYTGMPNDEEIHPRVSLIIPFEPKMRSKAGLSDMLMSVADKIEKNLMSKYPEKRVLPVVKKKLQHIIKKMACNPKKNEKSIAIFVSPLTEKAYYFTPTLPSQSYLPPVLVQNLN